MPMATAVVFPCSLCNIYLPTGSAYVSHMRLVHSRDPNFSITCGLEKCQRWFRSFGTFNSHVYRDHRNYIVGGAATPTALRRTDRREIEPGEPQSHSSAQFTLPLQDDQEATMDLTVLDAQLHQLLETDEFEQKTVCAQFILKLKEIKGISQTAVDKVVQGVQGMFSHVTARLKAGIQERLARCEVDYNSIPDLDTFINCIQLPFSGFETAHLQEKFYREHFGLLVSVACML